MERVIEPPGRRNDLHDRCSILTTSAVVNARLAAAGKNSSIEFHRLAPQPATAYPAACSRGPWSGASASCSWRSASSPGETLER
jgi:hypothetical protein